MSRRPQRLGELLSGVLADLAQRHGIEPPATLPNRSTMTTQPETIWRYLLPLTDEPVVRMPARSRVLSVGPPRSGDSHLDLWALVDPTAADEGREFRIVGTGNPMPTDCGRFVGTTYSHGGALIWHVFEAKAEQQLDGAA